MSDLNLCQFIGRLGRDPEVRYTANGAACANFSIAVGESWKDKDTGEKKERTEWVRCVAWNQLAEVVGEYLKKGAQVYVSGKMQTRKWEDKEGHERYTTEITVSQMQMLQRPHAGNDAGEDAPRDSRAKERKAERPAVGSTTAELDDDIPF